MLIGAALCAASLPAAAGAPLAPGDVAVVAVNTDGDSFAWTPLRNLPAGTVIHFTDSSVSNGLFRWTEHLGALLAPGPLNWTAPGVVKAGTVVRWDGAAKAWSLGAASGAVMDLSADGDQIVAYTGCIVSNGAYAAPCYGDPIGAVLLYAVNVANSGWNNVSGGTPSSSFIPPGLSEAAGTAVHLGNKDNAYYAGPRRGTASELRTALASPAHWITGPNEFGPSNWPAAFDVLGSGTLIMLP